MYLGKGPPRRRPGSNPIRVVILLILIGIGLYILTVRPESLPQPFQPTPTATRTAESHIAEAEELYHAGQLTESILAYEEAVKTDPTVVENYIPLARLLIFQHRFDEAEDYVNTALFVDPEYPAAHAINAMFLDWKASSLADEGLDEDAADMLREALSEVNRATESDPTAAAAFAYQSEILFDMGNYAQADEALATALLIDENNVDVQRIAGYLMEFRGYRDDAIQHYQKAIELEPNLALLHLALGRTYISTGDVDAAIDSLERSVALDPENAELLYFMGYAYFSIGERDFAADYFEQAIELQDDYPAAHCQLGLIYYQNRLWEDAVPELEVGVEGYDGLLSYRNAFCYYTLGLSYFYLNRCEEAYPLFDLVLEAIPDNGPATEGIRLCREAEAQGPIEDETTEESTTEGGVTVEPGPSPTPTP